MKFIRGAFFRLMSFMREDSAEYPRRRNARPEETGYCINCRHKADCWMLTDNFGPLCDRCITELETNARVDHA